MATLQASSLILARGAALSSRRPAPAALAATPVRARVAAARLSTARPSGTVCAASVGRTAYAGNGKVGRAVFTAAAPSSSARFKFIAIFSLFGIVLPTASAIAVALNSPVLAAGPLTLTAATVKGPAAVTVLMLALYFWFTLAVSGARRQFKVSPPATTGVSPDFDRYMRVQQNTIEGLTLFFPCLWLSALLVNSTAASVAGLLYCVGRTMFATGYWKSVGGRSLGFGVITIVHVHLLVSAGIGAARAFLAV